ncbi:MAG: cation diffusion facilitator family transporter [Nitrososphaerales archaeon]
MFHADPTREKYRSKILAQIIDGQRIAIISFGANLVIGVLEVSFGSFLGSLALSADGIHSFVDAVVSLTVWFGIIYSKKRADGRFHYGYYKFDAIFSLFAAMIMVVSGVFISYIGVTQYLKPEVQHEIAGIGGAVATISIVTAVVLAVAKNSSAKKSGLVSLKTDSYNSVKDASASVIALVGIAATWFGFYSLDSLAGLIIGIFVMIAGYFAIKESSLILADAYNNPEMLETIKRIATSVPGIEAIDDLRIRRNGPFLAVDMHIRVDGRISVFEADQMSHEVTLKMREDILSLGRINIKPEPAQSSTHKTARR